MNITSDIYHYMTLFEKSQQLVKNKPLSLDAKREMQLLLKDMDIIWAKLGYKERTYMQTWIASRSEWLDE